MAAARSAAALFLVVHAIRAGDSGNPKIEQKIRQYMESPADVSDADLSVTDTRSFISDEGTRREGDRAQPLRIAPEYFHPAELQMTLKLLDLMRHIMYATQGRIRSLDPILARHKTDPSLRMAFIYNRLRQLIVDMRRIYTVALKRRLAKRVREQVYWYSHCARKYVDVLYIVQFVIDEHTRFDKTLRGEENAPKMPGFRT